MRGTPGGKQSPYGSSTCWRLSRCADIAVAQGDEANVPKIARPSEADLPGHLIGEPVTKKGNAPVISPAPGKKYDDFQLAYALDLLRGKMTVASVTKNTNG